MSALKLVRGKAAVLVVDVQERLCGAMDPARLQAMVRRTRALLEGAHALGLPVACTEQYPKGLGHTLPALKELMPDVPPLEKLKFSAVSPELLTRLKGKSQLLVAGMETHICVYQTVRELVGRRFTVWVLADAVLSRSEEDRRVGLGLCEAAGAQVSTVEAALFDLLGEAGTPEFKRISQAVK